MITYFELISKIEELSKANRNEGLLSNINEVKINLNGDRYYRLIDHLSYAIEERLKNALDNIMEKMEIETMSNDLFHLEFNEILYEIDFCRKITNINLLDDENKNELNRSINKSVNNILSVIKSCFEGLDNKEEIITMIDENFIKEEL